MKFSIEKFQKSTEFAAAVAVVVSLLFLGYEVRQNTFAVKSAAAQAVNENFANWYSLVQGDRQLLEVSMAGMKDFVALQDIDKAQFVALHMALLINAQNAFDQWEAGWLSPEQWRAWDILVGIFFSTPGGRQFWDERSYVFGQSFQAPIEQVLKQEPNPKAKAWGSQDLSKQDSVQ